MRGINNGARTLVLLGLLTLLIVLIGDLVGGRQGMLVALAFAAAMNFFSYWFSDKFVLAMYRAKPAAREEQPELFRIIEGLTRKAGLPMPRVFIIPQDAPNAFATGRNPEHAALGVTAGLLRMLNTQELEGVIAHELGHVGNRDILVASIAATLAGAVMALARWLQFAAYFGGMRSDDEDRGGGLGLLFAAIVAPIAAILIQMAISRSREYQADGTGARMTGSPFGLAAALEKLSIASRALPMAANPATSHLFIVKPFSGSSIMNLFSTHPPIEERIKRLRAMSY